MHIRFAFVGLDTPRAGGTLRPVLEFPRTFLHCADPDAVGLADTAQDIAGRFQPLSQAGLMFVERSARRRRTFHAHRIKIMEVVVNQEGRVLIPAQVRRELGIDSGSRLVLYVEDGRVVMGSQVDLLDRIRREVTASWQREKGVSAAEEPSLEVGVRVVAIR